MSLLSPHLILVAVRQCANCTEKINLCHGQMTWFCVCFQSIIIFLILSLPSPFYIKLHTDYVYSIFLFETHCRNFAKTFHWNTLYHFLCLVDSSLTAVWCKINQPFFTLLFYLMKTFLVVYRLYLKRYFQITSAKII